MNRRTFSPATLKALANVVTGGPGNASAPPIGIYRTASQIEGLMMECNLDFRVGQMASRVTSLLCFLRILASDDPDAAAKLTLVIERVAAAADYAAAPERQQVVVAHLNRPLARDGLEIVLQGAEPRLVEPGRSSAVMIAVAAKVATISFDTVQRDIDRAMKSADDDPEDAVTAACSIIESVCRSILLVSRGRRQPFIAKGGVFHKVKTFGFPGRYDRNSYAPKQALRQDRQGAAPLAADDIGC